jgi:hypothetical protein
MKIYIENLPQFKLSKIETQLNKYLKKEKTYTQLFSNDGIYIIEPKQVWMLDDVSYHNVENVKYKNYKLVFDKSEYNNKKVMSQLPVDYIILRMTKTEYFSNNKSLISLVVEKSDCENIPSQIYFTTNEKIDILDNFFVTNELDEFLLCFYPQ